MRARNDRNRPATASPWRTTRISSNGSMLPPDSTTTTGPLERLRVVQDSGHPQPPGRLHDQLGPLQAEQQRADRSSSETVRTSSTRSPTIANGTGPGSPTAMPSAIVDIGSPGTGRPAASDAG